MKRYSLGETRLASFLNGLFVVICLSVFAIVLLLFFLPTNSITPLYFQPIVGLLLVAALSRVAADDIYRFGFVIYIIIFTFVLASVALLSVFLNRHVLLTGALGLAFVGVAILLARIAYLAGIWGKVPSQQADTEAARLLPEEYRLRFVLIVFSILWCITGVMVFCVAFSLLPDPLNVNSTMVAMSVFKFGTLSLLSFFTAWRISAQSTMALTLIAVFNGGLTIIAGIGESFMPLFLGLSMLDLGVALLLWYLNHVVECARLSDLKYFSVMEFRVFESLADIIIVSDSARLISAYQIARNVDKTTRFFQPELLAQSKGALILLQLLPIIWLHPPLSYLHPALRREIFEKRFGQRLSNPILDSLRSPTIAEVIAAAMRTVMQFAYTGYYSVETIQQSIGYVPFTKRLPDIDINLRHLVKDHLQLNVSTAAEIRQQQGAIISADIVIIGSGAAGALLAEQLAELNPSREILILEKGLYVAPQTFTENETEMFSQLYGDSAFQLSKSLRMAILQGSCVGGTTVVNNAVSFDTPASVLDLWNRESGLNAQIKLADFWSAQQAVKKRMHVRSIEDTATTRPLKNIVNPIGSTIQDAISQVLGKGQYGPYQYSVANSNISDCLGCGYCNIGCKYGRKLSMLDEVLPQAQKKFGGRLKIVAEADVTRLVYSGNVVKSIMIDCKDGTTLEVRNPKTVVISAGAIASSKLLMRSGISSGLPVGRGVSFNLGGPIYGRFGHLLNSHSGMQISHYLELSRYPSFVYETYYNPPVAQALMMPGQFDDHHRNMQDYSKIGAMAALVGTDSSGVIHLKGTKATVAYTPSPADIEHLRTAWKIMAEVLFASGALEVFLSTRHHYGYQRGHTNVAADNAFFAGIDINDIILMSAHPQGGNAISGTQNKGVVSPEFRVYGFNNLYVCDASVFPSSIVVNPQITIMTLAQYAAPMIR